MRQSFGHTFCLLCYYEQINLFPQMVIAKPSATLVVAPHTGATTSVSVVVYNLTCLELLLRIPSPAKRHCLCLVFTSPVSFGARAKDVFTNAERGTDCYDKLEHHLKQHLTCHLQFICFLTLDFLTYIFNFFCQHYK